MQKQTILERQRQYFETLEAKKVLALVKREKVALQFSFKVVVVVFFLLQVSFHNGNPRL